MRKKAVEKIYDRLMGIRCFAVYDTNGNRFLYAGRNADTKENAVKEALDFIIDSFGVSGRETEKMRKWSLSRKERFLESVGLIVKASKEKLEE